VIEMLLQADRLLTVDMVEQADAIYRRVAEQDPRNAIAVVGMARCALARGEDQEAYRLAARALDIDPENDMARRMTARMAEVLTYRGETLPAAASAPTPATTSATTPAPSTPSAATAARTPTPAAAPTVPVEPSRKPAPTRTPQPVGTSRSWLDRIRGR
jgi:thioredoxin-like negative regulator of GroEL